MGFNIDNLQELKNFFEVCRAHSVESVEMCGLRVNFREIRTEKTESTVTFQERYPRAQTTEDVLFPHTPATMEELLFPKFEDPE